MNIKHWIIYKLGGEVVSKEEKDCLFLFRLKKLEEYAYDMNEIRVAKMLEGGFKTEYTNYNYDKDHSIQQPSR
jgi:hypothetical protein